MNFSPQYWFTLFCYEAIIDANLHTFRRPIWSFKKYAGVQNMTNYRYESHRRLTSRGQRYTGKNLWNAGKLAVVKLLAKLSISKKWKFKIIEKLSISEKASNLVQKVHGKLNPHFTGKCGNKYPFLTSDHDDFVPFWPIFAFFWTTFGAFSLVFLWQNQNVAHFLRKLLSKADISAFV